jgi:SIR2-like domain
VNVAANPLDELVDELRHRRMRGDARPALLLGAGASMAAGIGGMGDLYGFVGCADFDGFSSFIEGWDEGERYGLLFEFLQTRTPTVTPGYQALAALCEHYYFDLVLTTNLDPLLDDALAAARLRRKDYIVLVNGVIETDWLAKLATAASPRVKVIKLHGDLFFRRMAWTREEMSGMVGAVREPVVDALRSRDLLVVGDSLRDDDICDLVRACEGTVWFVNPGDPPEFFSADESFKAVVGPDCTFEELFMKLATKLEVGASSVDGAPTFDDLMASIVRLAPPDGPPTLTGFLLAEPRVIVTDGYDGNLQPFESGVMIVASDERRFPSRFLERDDSYVFGPQLAEVDKDLKVPGLRLNTDPILPGLPVHVAVAAGESVGLSSGIIRDPSKQQLPMPPATVDNLVALDCAVKPGASGAPVVDGTMAVRGFVVAQAVDDPSKTLMYPAECWAPFVVDA